MLIRFTAENFLSFNSRIDFNMIANIEDNSFENHIVKAENENEVDLLRGTLIYGANASGKSNLIKAMAFAQNLIVKGIDSENIVFESREHFFFKLDTSCQNKPTRFEFEIKYKGVQYAYGFVFDKLGIQEEWLFEIGKLKEKKIFERVKDNPVVNIDFSYNLFKNLSEKERNRLQYEAEGSRKNLFLYTINQKDKGIDYFKDIFDWFKDVLMIIFPQTSANLLLSLKFDANFKETLTEKIKLFDFGIEKVNTEQILFEKASDIPHELKEEIIKNFEFGKKSISFLKLKNPYLIEDKDNKLYASKIVTQRKDSLGNLVNFDFFEESDGTRRMFDFIPLMITFEKGNKVFIIDEVERSLHSLLSKNLFDLLLNATNRSESQIIATTHEVQLMDVKKLFRKDEIWLVEKNHQGESEFYSLAGANLEGLDLQKGYLIGRYGAIPFLKSPSESGF